jgi:hypothetical protein
MKLSCRFPGVCLLLAFGSLNVYGAEQIRIEIREPAGISRSNCPVHGVLQLPRAVPFTTHFRLSHAGKPVLAQFRPKVSVTGEVPPGAKKRTTSQWWLDFSTPLAPHETREYVVQYGADIPAGPERMRGHKLTERGNDYVISNAPHLQWIIPRDLNGFIKSLDFPPAEHLRPDSKGLMIRDQQGTVHPLGGEGTISHVVREGTMAIVLRFQKTETHPALRGIRWTADLIFPSPVSWVEFQLRVNDPGNRAEAVGMQLHLNLDSPSSGIPTLVDLGASRTVYTSLSVNHSVELRAQIPATEKDGEQTPPWTVLRGSTGELKPFVLAPNASSHAEGWAHVMDRKRCLAIAFDSFAQQGEERIKVQGSGTLSAWKRFSSRRSQKRYENQKQWRSWLHFVHFPPQASARADPQQMQSPIVLRQKN